MDGVFDANEVATYAVTAHLPGAWPDLTCKQCVHYDPCSDKRKGRCFKAFEMRGQAYRFERDREGKREIDWWRGLPSISAATPACKYFISPETVADAQSLGGHPHDD